MFLCGLTKATSLPLSNHNKNIDSFFGGSMTPQDFALVIFGIVACFTGYSMFRGMLPLWGFLLGGWIAYIMFPSIMPGEAKNLLFIGIAFLIGGTIGAVIAKPLYYVIVFFSGAVLGGIVGIFLGALIDLGGINSFAQLDKFTAMTFPPFPHTPAQYLFMVILAIVMGVAAISFQQFMVTASSAFMGAAAIVSGVSVPIAAMAKSASGGGALMMLVWIIFGFVGMFVQYRVLGDET